MPPRRRGAEGPPRRGELASAVGSMNHVAFAVPPELFGEYRARLQADGVEVSRVLNHDDSPSGVAREVHDGTFVRSFYFQDPDGVLLEFACWTREFTPEDVARAEDRGRPPHDRRLLTDGRKDNRHAPPP